MKPQYLSGETIYLRPMVAEDKEIAVAWHGGPLPVNSVLAEKELTELHSKMWTATTRQYAIVRPKDDTVIGGASIRFDQGDRKASIDLHTAPLLEDAGEVKANALRILVPWLLEEHNKRRVNVQLAATDVVACAAAEGLGMFPGVRLREYWQQPGGRVDVIIYQIFNPHEEHRHA